MMLIYYSTKLPNYSDLMILNLGIVSLGLKCGQQLIKSRVQFLPLIDYSTRRSFDSIDLYIRALAEFCTVPEDKRIYQLQINKYQNYLFYTKHNKECTKQFCFCKKFQENETIFLSQENEQQLFMQRCIIIILQQYIMDKNFKDNLNVKYLYFSFLIQVLQVPQKAYYDLQTFYSGQQKLNLKDQYIKQNLFYKCESQFKNIFVNSIIQNQRLQILLVAEFDEQLVYFQQQLLENLIEVYNLFQFLCSDFINLTELLNKNEILLQKRDKLELKLNKLYDICPANLTLQQITEVYLQHLDNENKSLKYFIRQSKNVMLTNIKKKDLGIDLFNNQSCVIFVSLLRPIGLIKKASKTVYTVFGYNRGEILNKNCSILMANAIADKHNRILENFVEYGSMKLIDKGVMNITAKNKSGFIIQVQRRIRLNYTDEDFGVSGHFNLPIQSQDNLIIFPDGKVSGISQNIYDYIFRRLFDDDIDDMSNLNAFCLVPYLSTLVDQNSPSVQNKTTLMIVPLNQFQLNIFQQDNFNQKQTLQELFNLIDLKCGFLEIRVDFYTIISQMKELKYYQLSILSFRLLKRKKEKVELLNYLKKEINGLLNLNIQLTTYSDKAGTSRYQTKKFTNKIPSDKKTDTHNKDSFQSNNSQFQLENLVEQQIEEDEDDAEEEEEEEEDVSKLNQKEKKNKQNEDSSIQNISQTDLSKQKQEKKPTLIVQHITVDKNGSEKQFPNSNQLEEQIVIKFIENQNEEEKVDKNITAHFIQKDIQNNQEQQALQSQIQQGQISVQPSIIDLAGSSVELQIFSARSENQQLSNNNNNEIDPNNNQQQLQYQQSKGQSHSSTNQQQSSNSKKEGSPTTINKKQIIQQHSNYKISTSKGMYSSSFYPTELKTFQDKLQEAKQDVSSNQAEDGVIQEGVGVVDNKSINSSMHSSASQKRQVIQSINSQEQPKLIQGIKFVGYIALLILLVSNIVVYLVLRQNFHQATKSFDNMLIFPDIKDRIAALILNREFIRISEMEFNNEHPWKIQDMSFTDAMNLQKTIMNRQKNILSNLIIKKGMEESGVIYQLNQDIQMNLQIILETNEIEYRQYSLNYAFILLKHFSERYTLDNDAITTRRFIQYNYYEFMKQCELLFNHQRQAAQDTLDQIKSVIIVTLLIIEIVGFMVIMTLFPIYSMIQSSRETILKLFGTFSQDKLNIMINRLIEIIKSDFIMSDINYSNSNKQQIMQTIQLENSKKTQKKKIISHSSQLSKFSIIILIGSLITFVLISLYPIINLIISFKFIEEFQYNIQEIATVFNIKAHGQKVFASNYLVIRSLLIGRQYTEQNKLDFLDIQKSSDQLLTDLYFIEKNFLFDRSNDAKYKSYLLSILKNDLCVQIFEKYDQLATSLPSKQYFKDNCPYFQQGVLKRGLIVIFQDIFNTFDELQDIYAENLTIEGYADRIKQFDKEKQIYEIHQYWKIVGQSIEICKILLLEMSNLNLDNIQQIQTILFIVSIIILCLIFLTGWTQFLLHMSQQLNRTKNMFGLIHIDYLVENTYILHYINKELKKTKIQ